MKISLHKQFARPRLGRLPVAALATLLICLLGSSPQPQAIAGDGTAAAHGSAVRDVTFYVVSDTHYGLSPQGDATVPLLVDKMNALPGLKYPERLGGGTIAKPRGVLHLGDITNDAREGQWKLFVRDYGLTGKDGRLHFPVYETFGNHDGGSANIVRKSIRARNPGRTGLTSISDNGLFYSWDWDDVHFVSLGISPGTTCRPYDPEQSIRFAAEDLKKNVGRSGRPVVLMHHFGFDPHSLGWWPESWRAAYFDLIKDYHVAAIIHGHAHEPLIYQWNGLDVYHPPHFKQKGPKNSGPVTHGFFVFHMAGDEMTVAERKLDDTWGMAARKHIDKSAQPTKASVPDRRSSLLRQ